MPLHARGRWRLDWVFSGKSFTFLIFMIKQIFPESIGYDHTAVPWPIAVIFIAKCSSCYPKLYPPPAISNYIITGNCYNKTISYYVENKQAVSLHEHQQEQQAVSERYGRPIKQPICASKTARIVLFARSLFCSSVIGSGRGVI